MEMKYEINGITLNEHECYKVHAYYEAYCTAEYLMDNYGITDEKYALQLGYAVRDLMLHKEMDEEDAIADILQLINEED